MSIGFLFLTLTVITSSQQLWYLSENRTASACEMHDLEYHSAHAQMAWSQRFRKSEISLDTRKSSTHL